MNGIKTINLKIALFLFFIVLFFLSLILGYKKYSDRETLKRELNLDGLFVNVKDVKIVTTEASYFEEKPYSKIEITIPSLSSNLDDQIKSDSNAKETPNQIINRERFDDEFIKWLKSVYDKKEAKRYTKKIKIWYRDIKVIDEEYK